MSTYKEPITGWIDNLYGPTGVCAGVASGLLRTLHCNDDVIANIVPVDTCVAALLAVAWDVATKNCERYDTFFVRTTLPPFCFTLRKKT